MSEMCPQCGSGVRRDATAADSLQRQRWLCGSFETEDFNVRRSATCYERELSAKKAVISAMTVQVENLQKFKTYTHERLTLLGAPEANPRSPHTAAGCRVGGRFDWVEEVINRESGLADHQAEGCDQLGSRVRELAAQLTNVERDRDYQKKKYLDVVGDVLALVEGGHMKTFLGQIIEWKLSDRAAIRESNNKLRLTLKACVAELHWLLQQTNANPHGSATAAYQEAKALIAEEEAKTDG